jgi:hypothetical protein
MKKNSWVEPLLIARKISYTVKVNKFGENVFQCVVFKRIAKITENSIHATIEFPFGERPKERFDTALDFEYYLDHEVSI